MNEPFFFSLSFMMNLDKVDFPTLPLLISESKVAYSLETSTQISIRASFPFAHMTRITWLKWEDFEVSTFLLCFFSRDPFLNFQSALSHLFQRRSKTWHSKGEKLENALKIGCRTDCKGEWKKGNFILIVFQDCRGRSDRKGIWHSLSRDFGQNDITCSLGGGFSFCNRELENKFHPFGLLSIKYLSNKLPLTTAMLRLHTILPHVLWSNKAQQIVECHIISDPIYSTNKPFFIKEFRIYSLEHILIPKGIYGIKIIWFPIFSFPIKIIEALRRKNVVKQI